MGDDHVWTVAYWDGADKATDRVTAEGGTVTPNGDLLFGNGLNGPNGLVTRAFAAGTWQDFSLYA